MLKVEEYEEFRRNTYYIILTGKEKQDNIYEKQDSVFRIPNLKYVRFQTQEGVDEFNLKKGNHVGCIIKFENSIINYDTLSKTRFNQLNKIKPFNINLKKDILRIENIDSLYLFEYQHNRLSRLRENDSIKYLIPNISHSKKNKITIEYHQRKPDNLAETVIWIDTNRKIKVLKAERRFDTGHRPGFVYRANDRLIKYGYEIKKRNTFNAESKSALVDFQMKNNLPIGQLDYETLSALDLRNEDTLVRYYPELYDIFWNLKIKNVQKPNKKKIKNYY